MLLRSNDQKGENMSILTNFSFEGNQEETLKQNIEEITKATETTDFQTTAGVAFYVPIKGTDTFVKLTLDAVKAKREKGTNYTVVGINGKMVGEELMNEAIDQGLPLMSIDKEKRYLYFINKAALLSLSVQSGVGGSALFSDHKYGISEQLMIAVVERILAGRECGEIQSWKNQGKLVYRTENGYRSIVYIGTEKYQYLPQTMILELKDMFNKNFEHELKLEKYTITQELTDVIYDIPSLKPELRDAYNLRKELMPAIRIRTSDSGASSLTIEGGYRIGESLIPVSVCAPKHTLGNTPEKISEKAKRLVFNKIFDLPKQLKKLSDWKLTAEQYADALDYGLLSMKGVKTKKIPTGDYKSLLGELRAEIVPDQTYTLEDVAYAILTIPGRAHGMETTTLNRFATEVAQVPYALEKYKPTSEVVLLPY